MADRITLDVDLRVNTQNALQTVSAFKDDVDDKLSKIDPMQQYIESVSKTAQDLIPSLNKNDPFLGFAESTRVANSALVEMQRTIKMLSSTLSSGKIADGMTKMFESSYRTIMSSVENITKGFDKAQSNIKNEKSLLENSNNLRIASATGTSASRDMIRLLKIMRNQETGLTTSQFSELAPALNSIVRSEVDEYRRLTKSTPTLNELSKYLAKSEVFSNTAKKGISGYAPSGKQLESLARGLIIANRSNSYRDNHEVIDRAGIKRNEWLSVSDQLPLLSRYAENDARRNGLRNAFLHYGTQGNNAAYRLEDEKIEADRKVYAAYRKLVRNGNQQAIQYGLDAGLLRAQNGRYIFSGRANLGQMNRMAGLAARSVHEAKGSLPYYYTDPTSTLDTEKLLMRQNNVFNDALEVMEALSKQRGLTPDVNGHDASLFTFSKTGKYYNKFNSKAPKIKTLGTTPQYVVPKTVLDKNGNLVWRDPSWRKENGVQEKDDDQFATIGNSAFTYLLGMHENNTYGYGRDEEGRAIYQTPKVIRLDTSHLYKQIDEKGSTRMIVDPEKQKEADWVNKIFARKKTLKYGTPGQKQEEYISAFGDSGSITLIQKKDYDRIVGEFEDLGMANPFNNMNTGGLFISGDYKNASKMIDLSRKKATPGQQYSKLGYWGKNAKGELVQGATPTLAMVDYESLYDYLGIKPSNSKMRTNERLDGVNFFDPSVLGVNAQMRGGVVGKFMGQVMNWRKLLLGSHLLEDAYAQSRQDQKNMGLLVKNDNNGINNIIPGFEGKNFSFYMPQIGLKSVKADWLSKGLGRKTNEEISLFDVKDSNGVVTSPGLISEMNTLQGKVENGSATKDEIDLLNRIRSTYFFDIMDPKFKGLITDSTVKNNDKFRIISKRAFEERNGKKGLFYGEEWARDLGNGTVELTADQQRRYFEESINKTGGLWVSRTGHDFRTNKDYIPESLAAALGIDKGIMQEESLRNYDEYISRLTNDENARINFLKSMPMGRRLVESGQWNTKKADMLIQSHLNDVKARRDKNDLFLPEEGIDNLLTGVMPGSAFGNIFEQAFGIRVRDNNKYRKLFNYEDDEDRVFMKAMEEDQASALKANGKIAKLMLSRMPAAPGEFSVNTTNLGNYKAIQRAMDALGVDYDDTIFTDPTLQYTLMTGDYDGDTAWVLRGLSGDALAQAESVQRYIQNAREKIQEKYNNASSKEEKKKLKNDLEAFTNFGADFFTAQIGMGQSTAAIRNALTSLSNDDPEKWLAIAEAIDAYDLQTSEAMKEGKVVKLGSHADKFAKEGALFRRFVKEINAYSNGSEKANPNIFSTRLPEIQDVATFAGIVHNFNAKRNGESVGDLFNKGLDSWLFDQYGYSDSHEARAARHYGEMFKNIQGGIRLASIEDITNGRLIGIDWQRDLDQRRKAGEDSDELNEEQKKLNSYLRRLSQAEESDSLYEDFQKETFRLQSKKDNLLRNGATTDSKEVRGIQAKLDKYNALLAPMSKPFETARAEMLKKMKGDEEAVQARIEANQKWAKDNGIDLNANMAALLDPMINRDSKETAQLNWSDNAPWTYEVLKKKGFKLNNIRESSLLKRNKDGSRVVNPNLLSGEFKPWPHEDWKILDQKSEILAREMDVNEKLRPRFTDSAAALMGSLRHEMFAQTIESLARGIKDTDITSMYEGNLNTINKGTGTWGKRFKDLGLKFSVDDKGRYILDGATNNVTEGVNAALGTFVKDKSGKGGHYEGGTLSAFINDVVLANGAKVANIEGYNLNDKGIKLNKKQEDYTGRGTIFSRDIVGPNGEVIKKEGTFAPDLIMQNKDDSFAMYDYKSGEQGAYDSLFQMAIYAKDIQEKVKNGDKKAMHRLGWDKYVNDDGSLKIKQLNAYDTSTGTMLSWDVDQDVIDELDRMHGEAIANHVFENGNDRVKAIEKLRADAAAKFGVKKQAVTTQSNEDLVKSLHLGNITGKGDWYEDFIANKFTKDQDTLKDINSLAYKSKQLYGNQPEGGYSQFASARRNLEATLDDDVLDTLLAQARNEEDPGKKANAVATITKLQQEKRMARENLNEAEQLAVENGFKDVESYMMEQFFGVKKSSAVSAYNAINKRIANKAAEREGLLENKDVFQEGQWTAFAKEKGYDKLYEQSLQEEQKARETFKSLLPEMQKQTIRSNNNKLTDLLSENKDEKSPEQVIQDYYDSKYKEIENYIKQQQSDVAEFDEILDQKDKAGNLVLSKNSAERNFFESLKANALDNQSSALNALKDKYAIQASAQKEYEKSIGLSNGDKVKTRSQLQQEYLDFIKNEYDEAAALVTPDKLNALKANKTKARKGIIKSKTEEDYQQEIDDRRARYENAKEKMEEYESMMKKLGMTKETEGIQKQLDEASAKRLYTGGHISREEAIQRSYLSKSLAANQYRATLSEDELAKFDKEHTPEMLKAQAEKEYDQNKRLYDMQLAHQEEANQVQQENMLHNMDLSREQFERQRRRRGSRSRIAYGLHALEDRRLGLTESIRGYEQRNDALARRQEEIQEELKQDNLSEPERNKLESEQRKNADSINTNVAAIGKAKDEIASLSSVGAQANAVFQGLGQSIGMVAMRFGRQLFQKAIQETKQFVKQFDKSMTEIQMITLKSDTEIGKLGEKLIQKAADTGTTVTDVTSAASSLYRQGLSDEEVDTRLDDVLKFAKVAGIKTADATKIITTALQNGLVDTSEEAMDALVALGDSVATTAPEIAKGMQKSAAAAKQAGMSYGELTTLLAIGTSKTQLGGSAIGSALQTMIYRLYKVNKNQDFYDESGNHIMATDATRALGRMGISLFDENGNFRGPYQILQDIAAGWENADDVTQSAILSTLGAGRQRSNVATLIQGLAEDNGEIAGRYLDTAENSQGITDRKYEEYLDSLEAKMNGVKTAWDSMIESLGSSAGAKGLMDFVKDLINGFSAIMDSIAGIPIALAAAGVAITAIASSNPYMLAVLGVVGGLSALFSYAGKLKTEADERKESNSYEGKLKNQIKLESNAISVGESKLQRARELQEKAERLGGVEYLSEEERSEFDSILSYMSNSMQHAGESAEDAASRFANAGQIIDDYEDVLKDRKKRNAQREIQQAFLDNKLTNETINNSLGISSNAKRSYDEWKRMYGIQVQSMGEGWTEEKGLLHMLTNVGDKANMFSPTYEGENGQYAFAKMLVDKGLIYLPYTEFTDNPAQFASVEDLYDTMKQDNNEGMDTRLQFLDLMDKFYTNPQELGLDFDNSAYYEELEDLVYNNTLKTIKSILTENGFTDTQAEAIIDAFTINVMSKIKESGHTSEEYINSFMRQEAQNMFGTIFEENGVRTYVLSAGQKVPSFAEEEETGRQYYYQGRVMSQAEMLATQDRLTQLKNGKQIQKYEGANGQIFDNARDAFISKQNAYFADYPIEEVYDEKYKEAAIRWLKTNRSNLLDFSRSYTSDELFEMAQREISQAEISEIPESLLEEQKKYKFMGHTYDTYDDALQAMDRAKAEFARWNQPRPLTESANDINSVAGSLYATAALGLGKPKEISRLAEGFASGRESVQVTKARTADEMLEFIDDHGVNNFQEFLDALDDDSVGAWKSLNENFPELQKKLSGFLEFDAKGNVVGVRDEVMSDPVAFKQMLQVIAGFSEDHQNTYQTSHEISEAAKHGVEEFNHELGQPNYQRTTAYDEAYKTVYGSDLYNKRAAGLGLSDFEQWYETTLGQNYENGIVGLTDLDKTNGMQIIMDAIRSGQWNKFREDNDANILSQFTSGVDNFASYAQAKSEAVNAGIDTTSIKEGTDEWEKFVNICEKANITTHQFKQAEEDVGDTILKTNIALHKSGQYAEEYANSLFNLSKGGKTATKELASLRSKALSAQDMVTAAGKARGKAGKNLDKTTKELIANWLGVDTKDIDSYTKEMMDDIADSIEANVNEEFMETNVRPTIESAFKTLGEHGFDISRDINLVTDVNGEIDFEKLAALVEQYDASLAAFIRQYQGILAEAHIRVNANGDGKGNGDVTVEGTVKMNQGAGGKYNKGGGGGGGGGGKSAADKLIEDQKHAVQEKQHEIKMIQIEQTHYENMNEYDSYLGALDSEIAKQNELASLYAANIKALEAQRNSVAANSDDWWKLTEAIQSAEEAMSEIKNTIYEIDAKRIKALEVKQENVDKPSSHALSMVQKYSQRYQMNMNQGGNFESYLSASGKEISLTREQIAENEKQIAEWEKLLGTMYKDSTSWIETRDKIWEIKEENAQLENDIIQKQIEIDQAKVAQIGTDLENRQAPIEHEVNMLGTYAQLYANNRQYGKQREALIQTNDYYQQEQKNIAATIKLYEEQMKTLDEGSDAWYSARAALYQNQEAYAQLTASIEENKKAIEESLGLEIEDKYKAQTEALKHEAEMIDLEISKYEKRQDYVNTQDRLQQKAENITETIAQLEQEAAEIEALLDSGQLTNQDVIDDETSKLRDLNKQIASLGNDWEDTQRKINMSEIEFTIKQFNQEDERLQHEQKLIQYQQTRYQNAGEYTNVNTALSWDMERNEDRIELYDREILRLKELMEQNKDNAEEYEKLRQQLYKVEEQRSSTITSLEKEKKAYEENLEAIRKARTTVENILDKEIKERIRIDREMLSSTVALQNQIFNVIKKEKQDEWNLIKKDLSEKQKALNEEKRMISERLNASKNAMDQENKQRELAELQKQLAILQADPTRTKEAKELKRRIEELQQDISWTIAEQEADAAQSVIDDQLASMNDYITNSEEDLQELLSDANNFATQINALLGGGFDDFLAFMQEHNEEFKNKTEEEQKQMSESWHDTWKKMRNEVDTYWDEIAPYLENNDIEGYISYMKESNTYRDASETEQESLEYRWRDAFKKYVASLKNDAEFNDNHEVIDAIKDLEDATFNVRIWDGEEYDYNYISRLLYEYARSLVGEFDPNANYYDTYNGTYKKEEAPKPSASSGGTASGDAGSGNGAGGTQTPPGTKEEWRVYGTDRQGNPGLVGIVGSSAEAEMLADKATKQGWSNVYITDPQGHTGPMKNVTNKTQQDKIFGQNTATNAALNNVVSAVADALAALDLSRSNKKVPQNAEGGLVDYTGLAWVDGSLTRPESFLDATDTALLRDMLDTYSFVKTMPLTHIDTSQYGNNTTIGDINITINQAELKNDADYDEVARKVGRAFTKQLQRDGLNLSAYAW